MVDVDDFKKINDTYGHIAGDRALTFVTQAIISRVRRSDIVARYGGEEFIVYLFSVEQNQLLYKISEKVRRYIEKKSKDNLPLTVSIGIAGHTFRRDVDKELEDLIKKADNNLFKAKNSGKNKVIISYC